MAQLLCSSNLLKEQISPWDDMAFLDYKQRSSGLHRKS